MTHLVEPQTDADAPAIEALLDLSFGPGRRTKTSYRLRELSEPAEGLAFVVRDAALGLAGALSFWPLKIGADGADALLLGPLAVHPARQNLGIGLALMNWGIEEAKRRGHGLIILVGDAPYYARAGFSQARAGQFLMPGPVDPNRLLALELAPGALAVARGLVLPPHRFRSASAPRDTTWRQGPAALPQVPEGLRTAESLSPP